MSTTTFRRVEKPEFGFAISIPEDWPEFAPEPNPPYQVARFSYNDGIRHVCFVYRRPGATGLDPSVAANADRPVLEQLGFANLTDSRCEVAGLPAARLDGDKTDIYGAWFVRGFYIPMSNLVYNIGLGSGAIDADDDTFDTIINSFEPLAPPT